MITPERVLAITIDTEVDKSSSWRIATPPTFRSVTEGIPQLLQPLFSSCGARPTYLLSPEVIEDDDSTAVLSSLGPEAELGTHLHAEFVSPERRLVAASMGGQHANALQCQCPPGIELAKLKALTYLFERRFGYRPTSFRAGRYALGDSTLAHLAGLGYAADSSITPGLRWNYAEGVVDHRRHCAGPSVVRTDAGPIVELPISVRPGGVAAPTVDRLPSPVSRAARAVLGDRARYLWLRPSWESGRSLIRYVESSAETVLVLMFHSTEIIPGASPFAATVSDVGRIAAALHDLLAHCARVGIRCVGLTDAAALIREAGDR
ncbi:MAG TPA: hypothetical protein VGY97_08040 [Solirubrobacteraceae bacterium]|jgi:hypothetical protein|nr:hypothetical protein [Solirubrobacteraceae bacterium]